MKALDSILVTRRPWYCGPEVEKWLLLLADALAMLTAFYAAYLFTVSFGHDWQHAPFEIWGGEYVLTRGASYAILTLALLGTFWFKGHYSKRRPFWTEAREIVKVLGLVALIDTALFFFSKWSFSRATLLINWGTAPFLFLLIRSVLRIGLMRLGGWDRPMVIVGWGDNMLQTARAFEDERLMGYRLTAFLIPEDRQTPSRPFQNSAGQSIPFITLDKDPRVTVHLLGKPHVVLALEQGGLDAYQHMIQQLGRECRDLQIVPSLRGLPLYGMEVSHFFSHEVLLLTIRNNLARRGPQLIKRCFDIAASSFLLLLGFPVFLAIAIGIARTGRPIFYGHKRVGRNGKTFPCYKFRTMLPNSAQLLKELLERDPQARAEWDRDFKLKNDPRITPLGYFLRRTSLDELPQLWNVLKGEMSLVGPRPVVDAELERYGSQVDLYLEARPGITGLWQISGRNDISYDTRVYLDSWYVKNWSFFNDIVILIRTLKVILKRDGAY